jgi:hypothetical protein
MDLQKKDALIYRRRICNAGVLLWRGVELRYGLWSWNVGWLADSGVEVALVVNAVAVRPGSGGNVPRI